MLRCVANILFASQDFAYLIKVHVPKYNRFSLHTTIVLVKTTARYLEISSSSCFSGGQIVTAGGFRKICPRMQIQKQNSKLNNSHYYRAISYADLKPCHSVHSWKTTLLNNSTWIKTVEVEAEDALISLSLHINQTPMYQRGTARKQILHFSRKL